ncbi:MAG: TolC family protein, partial [Desulfuromonadales bacterium]|nr:TolC family protein [Desulfuromonadales bacterium]
MALRVITAVGLAVLISGCAFYPDSAVRLPVELPDRFVEQRAEAAAPVRAGKWWLRFDDQQLNRLMEEMFSRNLQLEQAFARLQQARSVFKTVRSARLPSINAEAQAGRSMQPTFAGEFTGDNYQFSGAAAYELDLWGKIASRA